VNDDPWAGYFSLMFVDYSTQPRVLQDLRLQFENQTGIASSLRSKTVRLRPGMPFAFPSELAFGFAGILTMTPSLYGFGIVNQAQYERNRQ